ncbi:MAG: hypothetical protein IT379_19470, partial [Deltaproteobacteria bacterium]|nr:hypothetical protein [Deltaproteobacteria bacterium]
MGRRSDATSWWALVAGAGLTLCACGDTRARAITDASRPADDGGIGLDASRRDGAPADAATPAEAATPDVSTSADAMPGDVGP